MQDTEVEKTLREIRDRVRVKMRDHAPLKKTGAANLDEPQDEKSLESLKANIAVIERTWNKLPPLTSYRRGWIAKFELWLKLRIKRATHWFTWEQINFNAASANSLKEISAILSQQERKLLELESALSHLSSLMQNDGELGGISGSKAAVARGFQSENQVLNSPEAVNGSNGHQGMIARQEDLDAQIQVLSERLEELRTTRAKLELT